MAALDYSERALADVDRLSEFLIAEFPAEALGTASLIMDAIEILRRHPLIGRPAENGLRELVISRGRSGYVALYLYDEPKDRIVIHAIRHQRQAGYP